MSKSVMKINVAKQFSKNPAGRYVSDGKNSGEVFLKNLLIPAITTATIRHQPVSLCRVGM